jgi:8-oxo-dGTP pyrophosphatase MutT (NUDIX family)
VNAIERISTREVYRNNWLTMREDGIRRPDGSDGIYAVVDKPTYALIIPLDGDRLHLVEQYRYPVGRRTWEFPQGTAPELVDVAPSELATRELQEETGLHARSIVDIGGLDVAPGLSSQQGRVFLATDLTEGEPEREAEEQDMRTAWIDRGEFEKMITAGEIADAQSIAAYTLLLLHER